MLSLSEVEKKTGLSRRMIQEYEKAGIAIHPETKNKYGYLEYDDAAVERLYLIRMYRELGYSKEKIKDILNAPDYKKEEAVETQIRELEKYQAEIAEMVDVAKAIQKTGINQAALLANVPELRDASYGDLSWMLKLMASGGNLTEYLDSDSMQKISDEFELLLIELTSAKQLNLEADGASTHTIIEMTHKSLSNYITSSGFLFSCCMLAFQTDMELKEMLDDNEEGCGEGTFDWIKTALRNYCQSCQNNAFDQEFVKHWNRIAMLEKHNRKPEDKEVQQSVREIYKLTEEAKEIPCEIRLKVLEQNIEGLRNPLLSEGRCKENKSVDFFSRALEIGFVDYCTEIQNGMDSLT